MLCSCLCTTHKLKILHWKNRSGTETQPWARVDPMAWSSSVPQHPFSSLSTTDSGKLNWFGWCNFFLCTATSFVPETLSAVSLQTGICWRYHAHTNRLHTCSEDFLKCESYWKQTGLYLHGRMSEIVKIKATFLDPSSSNSNWTDQAKHKVWIFGQAIKNFALLGETLTSADNLLKGKRSK